MPRNIVVCCDGTANEFSKNQTNVVKLYSMLVQDPTLQATFYHPGLGTMEPPGALTSLGRVATKVAGLAFGYGLSDDIGNAYRFLMATFQPGDNLYLFGFSRGSYTVRAVASLLHRYGLIRPGNESLVPYAIRMLSGLNKASQPSHDGANPLSEYFQLSGEFKATMSWTDCTPHFVGVWDTVSSVGWVNSPLRLPDLANNPDIAVGRHAVALDERRAFFRQNLWRPTPTGGPRDLVQVWFPGVHCDVGGGYPLAESGLSNIALEWMVREARAHGLLIDPDRELQLLGPPGSWRSLHRYDAPAHESLDGAWKIAEYLPRKHFNYTTRTTQRYANHGERRTIDPGSLIHRSAELRANGTYKHFLPVDVTFVD
jgi:uncharacterized protein (DUF2235 family)